MEHQISQPFWRLAAGNDVLGMVLMVVLVPVLVPVLLRLVLKALLPARLAGPRGTFIDTTNLDGHLAIFSLALWWPSLRKRRRDCKTRVYGVGD